MMGNGDFRLVVLISGSGSNLQAIIDQSASGALPVQIAAVISNRVGVHGLERAEQAGIEARVLDHKAFPDRESYDLALADLIDGYRPDLVVLAGFMRILTPAFIHRFENRMLNIHPSLLPKFRGLHTHQRAIDAGEREHGASVHFVTEELDGGPLILQASVPIRPDDDADRLAARVLAREHVIYPKVIGWMASGRLRMQQGAAVMDGKRLNHPLMLDQLAPADQ